MFVCCVLCLFCFFPLSGSGRRPPSPGILLRFPDVSEYNRDLDPDRIRMEKIDESSSSDEWQFAIAVQWIYHPDSSNSESKLSWNSQSDYDIYLYSCDVDNYTRELLHFNPRLAWPREQLVRVSERIQEYAKLPIQWQNHWPTLPPRINVPYQRTIFWLYYKEEGDKKKIIQKLVIFFFTQERTHAQASHH